VASYPRDLASKKLAKKAGLGQKRKELILANSTNSSENTDERAALRKAETELFQRLAKVVQPLAPEADEDEAEES